MIGRVAGIMISMVNPTGVLTKWPKYPKYGITAMTFPTMFSFLTIHWSGSSFASPFVMKPSSVMFIILWLTVIDDSLSILKQNPN